MRTWVVDIAATNRIPNVRVYIILGRSNSYSNDIANIFFNVTVEFVAPDTLRVPAFVDTGSSGAAFVVVSSTAGLPLSATPLARGSAAVVSTLDRSTEAFASVDIEVAIAGDSIMVFCPSASGELTSLLTS